MAIIGSFPQTISNGQVEDANVVMSMFNWILAQTNTNACPATSGSALQKANGLGGLSSAVAWTDFVAPAQQVSVASAATTNFGGSGSPLLNLTGGTAISSGGTTYLGPVVTRFASATLLTQSSTFNLLGGASFTAQPGDYALWAPQVGNTGWDMVSYQPSSLLAQVPRGYISGFSLSGSGTAALSYGAGQCTDSTHSLTINISSAGTKLTSANWVAGSGNGGLLDIGSIVTNYFYTVYAITGPTVTPDIGFSQNYSAPTLPSGYTKYRRIGAFKTDGSGSVLAFYSKDNFFQLLQPAADVVNGTAPTASRTSYLLSVPFVSTGEITARILVGVTNGSNSGCLYVTRVDGYQNDTAPGANYCTLGFPGTGVYTSAQLDVVASLNQFIGIRASVASTSLWVTTLGWTDERGQGL